MKTKNLLALCLFTLVFAFSINVVNAQDDASKSKYPSDAIGLGFSVATINLKSPLMGGHVVYAIDPDMHIGAQIAFYFDGGEKGVESNTYFFAEPYFKYFFLPAMKSFRPFGKLSFVVSSIPEQVTDFNHPEVTSFQTKTITDVQISGGGEWFPYKSVGVFGGFSFFNYYLDPSKIQVGLGPAFIGIEWFL